MKNLSISLLVFATILFCSCGDTVTDPGDQNLYGYEYFPIEIGNEWEYKVDSVLVIQGGTNNLVSTSYVKERVTDLISDIDGEKTYRLERSYRPNQMAEWVLTDVWTISKSDSRIIKNIENISFMKLVFPAILNTKWDGNVFFDDFAFFPVGQDNMKIYLDWDYKIVSRGEPRIVNDLSFDDALEVSHIDLTTMISKRLSYEYYAKDVGLIERHMEIFEDQTRDPSVPWVEDADKGFELTQTLVSYTIK